jgi:hypothetical protein
LGSVGSIGNVESRFIDGRQEHVRQGGRGLAGNDLLRNGRIQHGRNHAEPIVGF